MSDAQFGRLYIVCHLQIAGRVSTKVAGNHLLLSVTRRSERCRSGSEISGAGLHERQGAERRSRGVEGCGILDELMALRDLHSAAATYMSADQTLRRSICRHFYVAAIQIQTSYPRYDRARTFVRDLTSDDK
jgi:hypothetical protein